MNGSRMLQVTRRVDPALVRRFAKLAVANVSDCMSRMTAAGAKLRPLHAGGILAGTAFTVKCRPGDNLHLHKALDMAAPGDVIVVDAGGELTNALLGEMMLTHAETRGLAGVVINGAVRDLSSIQSKNFPVFAVGVTHRGPHRSGPGEINVPISLNGMIIEPGDVILGDLDGVVCVPFDDAAIVCDQAERLCAEELAAMPFILDGTRDRSWVDETMKKLGYNV